MSDRLRHSLLTEGWQSHRRVPQTHFSFGRWGDRDGGWGETYLDVTKPSSYGVSIHKTPPTPPPRGWRLCFSIVPSNNNSTGRPTDDVENRCNIRLLFIVNTYLTYWTHGVSRTVPFSSVRWTTLSPILCREGELYLWRHVKWSRDYWGDGGVITTGNIPPGPHTRTGQVESGRNRGWR